MKELFKGVLFFAVLITLASCGKSEESQPTKETDSIETHANNANNGSYDESNVPNNVTFVDDEEEVTEEPDGGGSHSEGSDKVVNVGDKLNLGRINIGVFPGLGLPNTPQNIPVDKADLEVVGAYFTAESYGKIVAVQVQNRGKGIVSLPSTKSLLSCRAKGEVPYSEYIKIGGHTYEVPGMQFFNEELIPMDESVYMVEGDIKIVMMRFEHLFASIKNFDYNYIEELKCVVNPKGYVPEEDFSNNEVNLFEFL